MVKQTLKTRCSSFGHGILTSDYSGLNLFLFFLCISFSYKTLSFPLGVKGGNQKFAKMDILFFPFRVSIDHFIISL